MRAYRYVRSFELFSENTLIEHDDHVEVNGVVFNKPFVEKPVSAEDHNIYMYYPTSAGEWFGLDVLTYTVPVLDSET